MRQIQVVVSGLPGKMAMLVAQGLRKSTWFDLAPIAFTGPEIEFPDANLSEGEPIALLTPENREVSLYYLKKLREVLVVDFTQPSAANSNVEFYCKNSLPFVMGTTGGDRKKLVETVEGSDIPAVIAPNMAIHVLLLQAAMEYLATSFPGALGSFELRVSESHQAKKKDVSGTAKAMLPYFQRLGIPCGVNLIEMIRDPEQQLEMGIPPEHLDGHGCHSYMLTSLDRSMELGFIHNVYGRDPYVLGTMKALHFLHRQVEAGVKGKAFSMIDVLKAG